MYTMIFARRHIDGQIFPIKKALAVLLGGQQVVQSIAFPFYLQQAILTNPTHSNNGPVHRTDDGLVTGTDFPGSSAQMTNEEIAKRVITSDRFLRFLLIDLKHPTKQRNKVSADR